MKTRSSDARRLIETHHLHVAGAQLAKAEKVILLIHGRHASGPVILPLAERLAMPGLCFLAPDADGGSWYPGSFLAPVISNEPYLSRALERLGAILGAVEKLGFDTSEQIALAGFSQGACLVLEYAARHPRRYAGVLGFTGGLIGPDPMMRQDQGSLDGTRIFLGSSEGDPIIPAKRVLETADHLKTLGASVSVRLYPGSDHIINDDAIAHARNILSSDVVA
jgi:phospholipase/carboxylesterase